MFMKESFYFFGDYLYMLSLVNYSFWLNSIEEIDLIVFTHSFLLYYAILHFGMVFTFDTEFSTLFFSSYFYGIFWYFSHLLDIMLLL